MDALRNMKFLFCIYWSDEVTREILMKFYEALAGFSYGFFRSRLQGSQCHPPPQGGTGFGEMDDISLPHGWSCTEQAGG